MKRLSVALPAPVSKRRLPSVPASGRARNPEQQPGVVEPVEQSGLGLELAGVEPAVDAEDEAVVPAGDQPGGVVRALRRRVDAVGPDVPVGEHVVEVGRHVATLRTRLARGPRPHRGSA